MTTFYGTVEGGRGQATRQGYRHIHTVAASWNGAVQVNLTIRDGVEWCTTTRTQWQGHGDYVPLFDGPFADLRTPVSQPQPQAVGRAL